VHRMGLSFELGARLTDIGEGPTTPEMRSVKIIA
jgi:hypothetical protein